MDHEREAGNHPVEAGLNATYRALLARGLQPGEAANLTAFLHGLPSGDFEWTMPEIRAIVRRRLEHAAEVRSESARPSRPRERIRNPRAGGISLRTRTG